MSENTTVIQQYDAISFYIAITTSFLSIIISSFISLNIMIITYITSYLHSPTNLLVSNTCLCTLFYSIISTMNTIIFYIEPISTDWACRIRGYINYVSLNLVIYSYVIQAISRLFWTVLYKYRYLLTNKSHIYLIICQICLSILFPLSSIITKDIIFRPFKLCLVSMKNTIHIFYLVIIIYILPLLIIIILYTIIYHHIRRSTITVRQSRQRVKRDTQLARNILILLSIFIFGGIPVVIYIIISNRIESISNILFLIVATMPTVSVAIEKIVTIILNKDIRKALKKRWIKCFSRSTSVQPFTSVIRTVTSRNLNDNNK